MVRLLVAVAMLLLQSLSKGGACPPHLDCQTGATCAEGKRAIAGRCCDTVCVAPGYALNGQTCACERMRCTPVQRLLHVAGRLFCASDALDCPPCPVSGDALEPRGCACVPVRRCLAPQQQWWRDARGEFACYSFLG